VVAEEPSRCGDQSAKRVAQRRFATAHRHRLICRRTDPDFDPTVRVFYYVRVLEIPTPRWTAFDAVRFNVEMPDDVPMTLQERAYTSPIWHTP